jgi:hypothetical protein
MKDLIKKILKEETKYSSEFKRRVNWFRDFIINSFAMEYPCDYEDFTHFMMGIHSEIEGAVSDGEGYDGKPVSDWLTYDEGVNYVEEFMIDELKEYFFSKCKEDY